MYVFWDQYLSSVYNVNDYELINIYPSNTYNIIISPFNMFEDGIFLNNLTDVINC